MKTNGRQQKRAQIAIKMNRQELVSFIDQEARKRLHISGERALKRIREGRAGDSYVWSDLQSLSFLLRRT